MAITTFGLWDIEASSPKSRQGAWDWIDLLGLKNCNLDQWYRTIVQRNVIRYLYFGIISSQIFFIEEDLVGLGTGGNQYFNLLGYEELLVYLCLVSIKYGVIPYRPDQLNTLKAV